MSADTLEHYARCFEAFSAEASDREPPWLAGLRSRAMERFLEVGFPTRKWEEWRYTNVARLAEVPFEQIAPEHAPIHRDEVERLCAPVYACGLFVFIDGRLEPDLCAPASLSHGAEIQSLATLRAEGSADLEALLSRCEAGKDQPFASLNTAFLGDGAVVRISRDADQKNPIHLVFISTPAGDPTITHPRVIIEAQPGSRAVVVQDHVSVGTSRRLTNSVTQIHVQENASLDWVLVQREHAATSHISNTVVEVERDARFASHTATLSGELVRNDLSVLLAGGGCEAELRGLYLGTADHVVDNHTLVDHAVPNGSSRELYKGILGDASRGVFRGRVVVRPGAQKTDAEQHNPNLLLSDKAEVDSKPQLEIYADDVKCSHGSTIGQIDPEALFYLRSRGVPRAAALDLLTRGFAAEITDAFPATALGDMVGDLLFERLGYTGDTP